MQSDFHTLLILRALTWGYFYHFHFMSEDTGVNNNVAQLVARACVLNHSAALSPYLA